jgi:Mn2+/Fe2+ NRAMP family transporter
MQSTAAQAKGEVSRGITWLARSGYAARGVVYLIIGIFAFTAGIGSGKTVGTKGAIEQLLGQPFGETLLWIMVVGLVAYVAWRVTQAITDPEGHGTDAKGLMIRAGLLGSAVTYTLLALFTLGLLGSSLGSSGGGGSSGGDFLSGLLGWKYSNYLVYVIALIPLGVGIAHIIKGWKAKFEKYFYASEHVMKWVRPISRTGLIARGVAFLIVAAMLFSGGTRYEPTDPPGLEDALNALQSLPFGTLWLSLIGLGLAAFAIYSFSEAIWRRIDTAAVMN